MFSKTKNALSRFFNLLIHGDETPEQTLERKARKAFRFIVPGRDIADADTPFLRTLGLPEISCERQMYKGRMVDAIHIKTKSRHAKYINLEDERHGTNRWSVSEDEDERTIYPDGFFTGCRRTGNDTTHASFSETLNALKQWEIEQLATYLAPHNDKIDRLSAEELKPLVEQSCFSLIEDNPQTGFIHWSRAARQMGVTLEEPTDEAARELFSATPPDSNAETLKNHLRKALRPA